MVPPPVRWNLCARRPVPDFSPRTPLCKPRNRRHPQPAVGNLPWGAHRRGRGGQWMLAMSSAVVPDVGSS